MRPAIAWAGSLCCLAPLCGCSVAETKEEVPIIDFEQSRFGDWNRDEALTYFSRRWTISIIEGRGPPWTEDPEFYIPNARQELQKLVDDCQLGATFLSHGNHGLAFLAIDALPLSTEKIACIRDHERRGLDLLEPTGP